MYACQFYITYKSISFLKTETCFRGCSPALKVRSIIAAQYKLWDSTSSQDSIVNLQFETCMNNTWQ